MLIERRKYLDKLIASEGNGLVKIITGGRRCGKSFLLFTIFHQYLIERGVSEDHIIELSLDDWSSRRYRDPDILLDYIVSHVQKDGLRHYIILDEIQLVDEFVEVLLSLMHHSQLDIYVSGSNSRFLSKDVVTEFRGRGDEIHVYPLSFKEFMSVFPGDKQTGWEQYVRYGGLPQILNYHTEQEKQEFLQSIWQSVYLSDVVGRYKLRNKQLLDELLQVVASQVGSSVNPTNLSNTFRSSAGKKVSALTIAKWLEYLEDSFLIERAQRYDIRGKRYIGTLPKYFFVDPGIRNSILKFRQIDKGHLMENIVYTELRRRGGEVDVGQIEYRPRMQDGTSPRQQLEVDFVVNEGSQRTYYQSAYTLYDEEQVAREKRPMLQIHDSFRKVLLTSDIYIPWNDEDGVLHLGLFNFLME
mgnify:CR=1 FL=1